MSTPKLEVTITAVNTAGRKKALRWEAEYGTDQEVFEIFAAIQTSATESSLNLVAEQHGWNKKAVG